MQNNVYVDLVLFRLARDKYIAQGTVELAHPLERERRAESIKLAFRLYRDNPGCRWDHLPTLLLATRLGETSRTRIVEYVAAMFRFVQHKELADLFSGLVIRKV